MYLCGMSFINIPEEYIVICIDWNKWFRFQTLATNYCDFLYNFIDLTVLSNRYCRHNQSHDGSLNTHRHLSLAVNWQNRTISHTRRYTSSRCKELTTVGLKRNNRVCLVVGTVESINGIFFGDGSAMLVREPNMLVENYCNKHGAHQELFYVVTDPPIILLLQLKGLSMISCARASEQL